MVCFRSSKSVLVILALASFGPSSQAQAVPGPATQIPAGTGVRPVISPRVLVVDDTAGCRFAADIQPAVDAAGEGDIVLVKKGTYGGFVIDSKSVSVFCESRPTFHDVNVNGNVEVKNLRADQSVVLRGVVNRSLTRYSAAIHDDDGPVWMERCEGFDFTAQRATVGLFRSRVTRTLVTDGATVFAYRSYSEGAFGLSGDADCSAYCSYDVYYSQCTVERDATPGGPGLQVAVAGRVYLFGTQVQGGSGGTGVDASFLCCSTCLGRPGWGGDALFVNTGTEAVLMATSLVPGQGGDVIGASWSAADGQPVVGAGLVTTLSGQVGSYTVPAPIDSGSSATLIFNGPPGWNAFVTYSLDYAPDYVPERSGYSVVGPASSTIFVGALSLSGTLVVSMPFRLPLGAQGAVLYTQAKLYDPGTDTAYLAEPSALLVVNDPCP